MKPKPRRAPRSGPRCGESETPRRRTSRARDPYGSCFRSPQATASSRRGHGGIRDPCPQPCLTLPVLLLKGWSGGSDTPCIRPDEPDLLREPARDDEVAAVAHLADLGPVPDLQHEDPGAPASNRAQQRPARIVDDLDVSGGPRGSCWRERSNRPARWIRAMRRGTRGREVGRRGSLRPVAQCATPDYAVASPRDPSGGARTFLVHHSLEQL